MKFFLHTILLAVTIACVSCGGRTTAPLTQFTVGIYTPKYASGFQIDGSLQDSSILLTIRNPWQGAQGFEQQIFLSRNNETPPKDFTGQIVHTPIKNVVCMSSSHVAMFDAIGEIKRIKGVSGVDYISNAYINEHKQCGEVCEVGYDTNLNFELLVTLKPSVVLLYGVTGENPAVTGKLSELGIPYIYIGDYVEESPLGKAEWLVAISALCGETQRGQELFTEICERYNTLKIDVAQRLNSTPKKVMLNTPYRDTWFMPSSRSYMVQLIHDAGGEYIYTGNNTGASIPIDIEEAYLLVRKADLWINVGQSTTLSEVRSQNPKFAQTSVVSNGFVYNNNLRRTAAGGSDFWESGVVCPDKVLSDLIHIIQGDVAELHYYHQLQ